MQCVFIKLFLKASVLYFIVSCMFMKKNCWKRDVLFSVNSYLAIVYDRFPHNIVFHQEFIIVLYFGAKNCFFGGRGRVGVIYPTIWATVGTTVLWTLNEIPLVQIERSGNLFGFRAYLSSFLCCNLQNIETKAVSFIQFYELYFQPKHIGYDLMLT